MGYVKSISYDQNTPITAEVGLEDRPLSAQPKGLYDKLSTNLKEEIKKLQAMRYPTFMYVPPIPALALRECKSDISSFWSVVEEIRRQFSSCRRKYGNYQNIIANPGGKSLGKLIQQRRDAISDVEKELNILSKRRTDGRVLMEIWDSVARFDIGGKGGEIEFSTGANIKSLLSKSFNWIRSWIVRGRARSLFNIYGKTLSIKDYDRLLHENFRLPKKEIERQTKILSNYSKDVEKATDTSPQNSWSDET